MAAASARSDGEERVGEAWIWWSVGLGRRRVKDEQPTVLVVSTNTKWGPHQPARVQLPEGMDH